MGKPTRYEQDRRGARKFWEIELTGVAITTKWGKVGGGSTNVSTKKHADAAAAKKRYDKLVKDKLDEGYEEVDGETAAVHVKTSRAKAKADAAILGDAKDPDAYLVYADAVHDSNPPLAEWLVLAHQLAAKPNAKLEKAEAKLFALHDELHDRAVDLIRSARLAFKPPAKDAIRYRYDHSYSGWHRVSDVVEDVEALELGSNKVMNALKAQIYPIPMSQLEYDSFFEDNWMYEGTDLREHIDLHHAHWKITHVLPEGESVRLDWHAIVDISVRFTGPLAKVSPNNEELQQAISSALYILEVKIPSLRIPAVDDWVECNEKEPFDDELKRIK